MKKETSNWLEQADSDYKDAKLLWDNHRYGAAILFYQQAVEKLTKGYIVEFTEKVPTKTHRIEDLIKEAKLNIKEIKAMKKTQIEELSKGYIRVRYPDLNKQYYRKRERAEPLVKVGEKLYLWIKNKFSDQ